MLSYRSKSEILRGSQPLPNSANQIGNTSSLEVTISTPSTKPGTLQTQTALEELSSITPVQRSQLLVELSRMSQIPSACTERTDCSASNAEFQSVDKTLNSATKASSNEVKSQTASISTKSKLLDPPDIRDSRSIRKLDESVTQPLTSQTDEGSLEKRLAAGEEPRTAFKAGPFILETDLSRLFSPDMEEVKCKVKENTVLLGRETETNIYKKRSSKKTRSSNPDNVKAKSPEKSKAKAGSSPAKLHDRRTAKSDHVQSPLRKRSRSDPILPLLPSLPVTGHSSAVLPTLRGAARIANKRLGKLLRTDLDKKEFGMKKDENSDNNGSTTILSPINKNKTFDSNAAFTSDSCEHNTLEKETGPFRS